MSFFTGVLLPGEAPQWIALPKMGIKLAVVPGMRARLGELQIAQFVVLSVVVDVMNNFAYHEAATD